MHDSAREAGCYAEQHYKWKAYWYPELSYLRDRKRFWWKVWVDCDRPREGAVYNVYKSTKKFILRLKRGKAPGMDGISHEHLIFGNSEVLRSLLASLYSSILSTGYIPVPI